MNRLFFALLFSLLPLSVLPSSAVAQELEPEPLGTISVSDLLLAPRFTYSEPSRGHFAPGDSYIAIRWKRDEVLSAQITLGTQSLINIPNRHVQINGDTVNVIEAYGQGDGSFGRFRFGLIPIPFGVEGGAAEGRLRFPRSLLFERGIIGLRDHGISYSISHERFWSDWAIHNGESGRDIDNKTWYTTRWGYVLPGKMRIGVSGQTGRTTPASTGAAVQTPDVVMDLAQSAKFRIGNAFFHFDTRRFGLTFEGTIGEIVQDVDRRFQSGHADIYIPVTPKIAALGRYDFFDPKTTALDRTEYVTIGISYRTGHDTSEIYLFGTQELKPEPTKDIHRFMVMWKLTPQIYDRR